MATNRTIGKNNKLPWNYPEDLKYFRKTTSGHPIIMGLKTYNSIGRPLPNRRNLVLTRQDIKIEGVEIFHSIPELLNNLKTTHPMSPCLDKGRDEGRICKQEEVFIIGGANIYKQFLPLADKIYLTQIKKEYNGDTFFPDFEENFTEVSREKHEELDFIVYNKNT